MNVETSITSDEDESSGTIAAPTHEDQLWALLHQQPEPKPRFPLRRRRASESPAPGDVTTDEGDPASENASVSIDLRLLIAAVGAVLCGLGVVGASPLILAIGVGVLISTAVVPDISLSLPSALTGTTGVGLSQPALWLFAGTALVAFSVHGVFRRVESEWPLAPWLVGLSVVVAAAVRLDGNAHAWRVRWPRLRLAVPPFDLALTAAITVAGFILRVRQLETLPAMHGDEGEMSMLALRVGAEVETLPPFTTGFLDHPTLFHFLQKLSMMIFGESVTGVRMNSAIVGALCIPAIYVVGRLHWSRRVGVVAAAVLAFSHVHIHFSRMALNNIHSVFMGICMVGCLLWGERALRDGTKAVTPLLLTGISCGLAQYLYYGSRLLPVILGLGLVVLTWRYRAQFLRLLLVPFGFALAWMPIVPRYLEAPKVFTSRQNGVGVFSEANRQAVNAEGTWDVLLIQFKRNLRFLIDSGDISSFYFSGAPGLNTVAAILFWAGLGLTLTKIRSFNGFIVLAWFILGLVLGGVLTTGSPAATRLVMMYPAVALLGGIAVDHFAGIVSSRTASARRLQAGVVLGLAGLLAFSGYQTYFEQFASNPSTSGADAIGRDLATYGPDADTFLIGEPVLYAGHGTLRFIAHPVEATDLFEIGDFTNADNSKPGLFVIAIPEQEAFLREIEAVAPGGRYEIVRNASGVVMYHSYLALH